MPRLIPTFTTGFGPDRPLDPPNQIFFPSITNDGPATTVKKAAAAGVQASTGPVAGLPAAMIKPNLKLQYQRVYSPSRRMFPRAF